MLITCLLDLFHRPRSITTSTPGLVDKAVRHQEPSLGAYSYRDYCWLISLLPSLLC